MPCFAFVFVYAFASDWRVLRSPADACATMSRPEHTAAERKTGTAPQLSGTVKATSLIALRSVNDAKKPHLRIGCRFARFRLNVARPVKDSVGSVNSQSGQGERGSADRWVKAVSRQTGTGGQQRDAGCLVRLAGTAA